MQSLWKIALASLRVAFLSFGGGNAVMGFIQMEFVQRYRMISEEEFNRIFSLTNMFPGPLVVNTVSLIGYKAGGLAGGIIAFILILFPGPILVTAFVFLLHLYVSKDILLKISLGVTPVIIALLIEFMLKSFKTHKKLVPSLLLYGIFFVITLVLLSLNMNIALVFLLSILTLWVLSVINFRVNNQ